MGAAGVLGAAQVNPILTSTSLEDILNPFVYSVEKRDKIAKIQQESPKVALLFQGIPSLDYQQQSFG